jgi:hypothetical protein
MESGIESICFEKRYGVISMNDPELNKKLKQSGRVSLYLVISEVVFLISYVTAFTMGYGQSIGFVTAGTLAIAFFWLFIQQKIMKNTYKLMLDYKFEDLSKNVKKSSDKLLDNLTQESTELIDEPDFDITKLKGKKDSDLV